MCRLVPALSTNVMSPMTMVTSWPTPLSMFSVSALNNIHLYLLCLHWWLESNNMAIIATASLQRSLPECWHQPTKSTRSSKTTRPWWTVLLLGHPCLELHGELMNVTEQSELFLQKLKVSGSNFSASGSKRVGPAHWMETLTSCTTTGL